MKSSHAAKHHGIAILVSLAIFIGLIWVGWHWWIHSGAPTRPGFAGYITSAKLADASIESTELVRIEEHGMEFWRFDYISRYDSGVTLYQRSTDYPDITATCKTKASSSTQKKSKPVGSENDYTYTCKQFTIKNGGRYIITTAAYQGKLFGADVIALIGNTELYFSLPKAQMESFANYDGWQSYFDSLRPVDLSRMPYKNRVDRHHGA